MKISSVFESKTGKVLLIFIIVLGVITIAKTGYHFGQWLFVRLN